MRHLSLPTHGAIELGAGIVMMLAPAALSFAPVALIVTALLGAVLTGAALGVTAHGPAARGTHGHFDSVFVLATAIADLALAVAGQPVAALFLAGVVALQAALGLTTSYAVAD
jgi:hypothetical protein